MFPDAVEKFDYLKTAMNFLMLILIGLRVVWVKAGHRFRGLLRDAADTHEKAEALWGFRFGKMDSPTGFGAPLITRW